MNDKSHAETEGRLQAAPADLLIAAYEAPHLEREKLQFPEYLQVDAAHVIMLHEQKILDRATARAILQALGEIEATGVAGLPFDARKGSFLHQVESFLFARIGERVGGMMHTGRSRLDQGPAVRRLYKRRHLIEAMEHVLDLQAALIDLARLHEATVMPGFTCLQHAHPSVLGHYLLGICSKLADDFDRLRDSFGRLNRNPLGGAGLAGTSWPIDRLRTTELLGFDGLVENSKLAREAWYAAEVIGDLSFVMGGLNDFATDLHLWSSFEFGYVETADEFCGTSSIFPQKKNPTALEAIKFSAGESTTWLASVLATFRAEGTGDVVMKEAPLIDRAFQATIDSLRLMTAIVRTLKVNEKRMLQFANANWSTATGLADCIVREKGLSFREAHHLVARLVRTCIDAGIPAGEVTGQALDDAAAALGMAPLRLGTEALRRQLDATAFAQSRTSLGGTSPEQIARLMQISTDQMGEQGRWLAAKKEQVAAAARARQAAAAAIVAA